MGDHEGVSDDYDIDTYGVWDPIGNPHSADCLCSNCGPTEYALNVQAEAERRADERARNQGPCPEQGLREHREKYDAMAWPRRTTGRHLVPLWLGLKSARGQGWHDGCWLSACQVRPN